MVETECTKIERGISNTQVDRKEVNQIVAARGERREREREERGILS